MHVDSFYLLCFSFDLRFVFSSFEDLIQFNSGVCLLVCVTLGICCRFLQL